MRPRWRCRCRGAGAVRAETELHEGQQPTLGVGEEGRTVEQGSADQGRPCRGNERTPASAGSRPCLRPRRCWLGLSRDAPRRDPSASSKVAPKCFQQRAPRAVELELIPELGESTEAGAIAASPTGHSVLPEMASVTRMSRSMSRSLPRPSSMPSSSRSNQPVPHGRRALARTTRACRTRSGCAAAQTMRSNRP